MLQELQPQTTIVSPTLTLTNAAVDAVKNILQERSLEGYALRVYVAGGGCCSVNFGMALDNNFRDLDSTFEIDGVKVVVDEVSAEYLQGATVDFVNDPQRGAGFAVDSPVAKSHSHDHGEGGCGCGGGGCGCGGEGGGSCSCQN